MFSRSNKILCFAVFAMFCGCGQTKPVDTLAKPEVQTATANAAAQSIVVDESSTELLAGTNSTTTDQEVTKQTIADVYQPPYPDRVDLFLAPKRKGRSRGTFSDQEDAVELLGFVNVDRHLAVLMINGNVYPIAEGDSLFGVEVISIQPPAVVLQRGRQRWQASLEN